MSLDVPVLYRPPRKRHLTRMRSDNGICSEEIALGCVLSSLLFSIFSYDLALQQTGCESIEMTVDTRRLFCTVGSLIGMAILNCSNVSDRHYAWRRRASPLCGALHCEYVVLLAFLCFLAISSLLSSILLFMFSLLNWGTFLSLLSELFYSYSSLSLYSSMFRLSPPSFQKTTHQIGNLEGILSLVRMGPDQ